jgi:hypothetical protein
MEWQCVEIQIERFQFASEDVKAESRERLDKSKKKSSGAQTLKPTRYELESSS